MQERKEVHSQEETKKSSINESSCGIKTIELAEMHNGKKQQVKIKQQVTSQPSR